MALNKVASDYSKYCQLDLETKLQPINKSVDDMLARLEEFQTMITFVQQDRGDSSQILTSLIDYSKDMDDLCGRIDRVESLVSHIKSNLNTLEEAITKTEEQLGCTESSIKVANIFMPFSPLFKKASETTDTSQNLEIFKTEDYFK